jgi:transcriptional regulator with XRE-family HTH domain
MLDLSRLGRELRAQRRSLRIPSAELARRIGVSPTYIWLIEHAKPRTNGEPSRPSEHLLRRWTAAIGMSAVEAQEIRELAGYFGPDVWNEQPNAPNSSDRSLFAEKYDFARNDEALQAAQDSQSGSHARAANLWALRRWAGAGGADTMDEAFIERLQNVLEIADRNGRSDEVRALVHSFLSWLQFYTEQQI